MMAVVAAVAVVKRTAKRLWMEEWRKGMEVALREDNEGVTLEQHWYAEIADLRTARRIEDMGLPRRVERLLAQFRVAKTPI